MSGENRRLRWRTLASGRGSPRDARQSNWAVRGRLGPVANGSPSQTILTPPPALTGPTLQEPLSLLGPPSQVASLRPEIRTEPSGIPSWHTNLPGRPFATEKPAKISWCVWRAGPRADARRARRMFPCGQRWGAVFSAQSPATSWHLAPTKPAALAVLQPKESISGLSFAPEGVGAWLPRAMWNPMVS